MKTKKNLRFYALMVCILMTLSSASSILPPLVGKKSINNKIVAAVHLKDEVRAEIDDGESDSDSDADADVRHQKRAEVARIGPPASVSWSTHAFIALVSVCAFVALKPTIRFVLNLISLRLQTRPTAFRALFQRKSLAGASPPLPLLSSSASDAYGL